MIGIKLGQAHNQLPVQYKTYNIPHNMNVLINKPTEALMYKINCTRLLKLEVAGVSEDYEVVKLYRILLNSVLGTM